MDTPCVLTSRFPGSLRIAGELDISALSRVSEALDQLALHDHVYLELSNLTFMDSAGVHAVIYAAKLAEPTGRLVLIGPTRQVQHVLDVSGVAKALPNLEIVHAVHRRDLRSHGTCE
jgi:anti-anti-sigma factor